MLRQTIEYRKQELMNQIDEKLAIAEERHEKAENERLQKLKEHVWRFVYTFSHQCGLVIFLVGILSSDYDKWLWKMKMTLSFALFHFPLKNHIVLKGPENCSVSVKMLTTYHIKNYENSMEMWTIIYDFSSDEIFQR